jgi:hypothetical protein
MNRAKNTLGHLFVALTARATAYTSFTPSVIPLPLPLP